MHSGHNYLLFDCTIYILYLVIMRSFLLMELWSGYSANVDASLTNSLIILTVLQWCWFGTWRFIQPVRSADAALFIKVSIEHFLGTGLIVFCTAALYNLLFCIVAHLFCFVPLLWIFYFSSAFSCMALNSLYCAEVPLRNCSLTHLIPLQSTENIQWKERVVDFLINCFLIYVKKEATAAMLLLWIICWNVIFCPSYLMLVGHGFLELCQE